MKRRILSTLLAFCMLLVMLPGTALAVVVDSGSCGENGGNVTWTLDGNGTLTIRGTGKMKNYSAMGTPWYGKLSAIKTVGIEKGVTSIGRDAFWSCRSLTSVTIPNSVTSIGAFAFAHCSSLSSVTIPNSVTSIANDAFLSCSSLSSVTIPSSVTSIGSSAFALCSNLTSVRIPNSITSIENGVFSQCHSLTSVTIPNSVTSINSAFYNCNNLNNVYYTGSKSQWERISIDNAKGYNNSLLNANIHYSSASSSELSAPKISLTTSTTIQEGSSTSIKWNAVTGATGYLLNVKTKNTYLSKDEPISTGKKSLLAQCCR